MQIGNLAGRMAAQRDRQFIARNAATIVFHRDQAHATSQQAHGDLRGAGVERVIDEFAHYRSRALHHFSRRYLADELIGQVAYRAT